MQEHMKGKEVKEKGKKYKLKNKRKNQKRKGDLTQEQR